MRWYLKYNVQQDAMVALYIIDLHDLRSRERLHNMEKHEEARTRAERNSARGKLWSEITSHVKRPSQKNAPLMKSTEPEVYFPLEV